MQYSENYYSTKIYKVVTKHSFNVFLLYQLLRFFYHQPTLKPIACVHCESLTNTKETNSSYFCFTSSFFFYLPTYCLTYLNPSKFSRIYLQPKVEKLSILPTIVVQSLLYWNRLSLWLIPHFSVLYLTQYYLQSCCVFNIYDQKIWVRSL